jgi:hypothetical protein
MNCGCGRLDESVLHVGKPRQIQHRTQAFLSSVSLIQQQFALPRHEMRAASRCATFKDRFTT